MSSVAMMASQDSVIMSATITKFLQLAQERALDDKISSLQGTVASLNDRTNKSETRISQVEADKTQLQNRIDDAEILISQTRADNTKLQDEITELRAQLSHAEDLFLQAETSRAQYQEDQSRQSPEPQQNATQLRGPRRRQLHDDFFEDTNEQQPLPQEVIEVKFQSPPHKEVHSHNRAHRNNRSPERPYPRGVKRAHVDNAAEPPRRAVPSQKAGSPRRFEEGSRIRQMKRSDRIGTYDDEVPRREEKRQSHVEDRSTDRRKEFVAYYHSMRREYDENKHGKNQRAFICRFIDGIGDRDFSNWLQECLKAQYPNKVHDAKRPAKSGDRTVALGRDLTWDEVKTLIKYTPHPSFTD